MSQSATGEVAGARDRACANTDLGLCGTWIELHHRRRLVNVYCFLLSCWLLELLEKADCLSDCYVFLPTAGKGRRFTHNTETRTGFLMSTFNARLMDAKRLQHL